MRNLTKGAIYAGMKFLPGLVIILVGCLMAIALSAAPVQASCPSIELSSNSGAPGINIAVNGRNFHPNAYVQVYYDGTSAATGSTDFNGNVAIIITIPESCKGAHRVLVVVGGYGGTVEMEAQFTVTPRLIISPEEGPVGTDVTVKGQGFGRNETDITLLYYLDGNYKTVATNITANDKGSWKTSFPVPPSTRGEHKLDAQGTQSKLHDVEDATFKVTSAISLDKLVGVVGETITITGSTFASNERGIQILFAGQPLVTDVRADVQGNWVRHFSVPEMPRGMYSVTVQGEQTTQEDVSTLSFRIEPAVVLSPDEGCVGSNLTVTGRGFAANKDVVVRYEGSQRATASTNDKGSFVTSLIVPESQHGGHQVAAEDAARNKASAIFTMESDPPDTPRLISPSSGSVVGFVGMVRPTFEWSEVSDESGVRYSVQIATSTAVTATKEFVNPVVSAVGIVGTKYTLDEAKALPYGTYYWIVQAVDGAGNEGGWTAPRSFRAGLLPLWAFIAVIAAAVAGIIFLIRSFLTKR